MSYQPTAKMKRKLNLFVFGALIAFVIWIIVNLYATSITDNERYQTLANDNQFASTIVKANRGSIYDANGETLAQSATVYSVNIDPLKWQEVLEKKGEEESKRQLDTAVTILCEELSTVDKETIISKYKEGTSNWANIAQKIEKPKVDRILARASEEKLGAIIYADLDTKRYYPQNELAAAVIGFTNYDGDGIYGVEAQYNDYLKGVDGKVISAVDAYGEEMPYKNDKIYDAQDGNSLYLTIDMTLQYCVEKHLEEAIVNNNVQNRACAIMMNVKTGAILAMASTPGYDLNDRNSIYSLKDQAALADILDKDEYNEKYAVLREQQWKNKAITETYYPGSVFKVITGSAALEERAITLNSSFYCEPMSIAGTPPIHCWTASSHGSQNFVDAMTNSCNPAFIQIGQFLGPQKFSEYFTSYGFTETTGIDLPSESSGIFIDVATKGPVELASSSFGQTNKVTPIQMITAYAAVINGGYLLQPYVVNKIVDTNGNVVLTKEKSVKRQVISEETSKTMRETLESVVNTKGGSNAYIKGYAIGGKSGTSEKQEENNRLGVDNLYVSSYCAFAPADDPEIILLVMVDEPMGTDHNGAHVYYGSLVAVPVVTEVLKESLKYLGYYPEYTDEELAALGIQLPSVEGESVDIAKATLEQLGLQVSVYGEGKNVVSQVPSRGSTIPTNGKVILYTEKEQDIKMTTVPNVKGYSVKDVNSILTNADLNFKVGDGAANHEGATSYSQNYAEGDIVPVGTIIEVVFVIKNEH